MAASVRIEDEAFSDRRYDRLAAEAGLADADHARGKMAVLWRQCTLEQRHVLPVEDVVAVLGPNALVALTAARLGDKVARGIRIRGTKGRIEWLQKLRENGAKGGRPRNAERKPKGYPSGSTELNPPAPAPAPAPAQKTEDKQPFAASPPAAVPTPKVKTPRPRNETFDAVAEVTGLDPATAGSVIGKVAATLAKADPPYTPADVREFGERFWEFCTYAQRDNRQRPTPTELEKNIGLLRAARPTVRIPVPSANGSARDEMAEFLRGGNQ